MSRGLDYLYSPEKRAFDIATATVLSAMAIVPATAAAVALKYELDIPWNEVEFTQERLGLSDELFGLHKLRTLPLDKDGPFISQGTFDTRARRWGRRIRQIGVDEIPQFLNVLRGDMSMVGPRPLHNNTHEQWRAADPVLYEEWFPVRSGVRPGVCGPSQVLRHSKVTIDPAVLTASMRLDLEYFDNATLGGDMTICARTPFDVLRATHRALRSLS